MIVAAVTVAVTDTGYQLQMGWNSYASQSTAQDGAAVAEALACRGRTVADQLTVHCTTSYNSLHFSLFSTDPRTI